MLICRQLFDQDSSSYTYLLGDLLAGECLLIDPVKEQIERDLALIAELGLRLAWTLETHVHADHLSASPSLHRKLGCKVGLAGASGAAGLGQYLAGGDTVHVGSLSLQVLATPGHTSSCVCYYEPRQAWLFTGDTLLIRGCGRTDFQEGDAATLYESVTQKLFTLPEATTVYPAHDYKGLTCSSIAEEKRFNPRLARSKDEFVALMKGLKLALPRRIHEAVPANLNYNV